MKKTLLNFQAKSRKIFFQLKKKQPKIHIILTVIIFLCLIGIVFSIYPFFKSTISKPKPFDEEKTAPVNQNFSLLIPKIGVNVPVVAEVDPSNRKTYLSALKHGVAHYKGSSLPVDQGKIIIFGHSSLFLNFDKYSEVFLHLNNLENGDEIILYYKNVKYHFVVKDKKFIKNPDELVLTSSGKSTVVLMTCWPPGSDFERIIVSGEIH